jgi:hypothetical protein
MDLPEQPAAAFDLLSEIHSHPEQTNNEKMKQ